MKRKYKYTKKNIYELFVAASEQSVFALLPKFRKKQDVYALNDV